MDLSKKEMKIKQMLRPLQTKTFTTALITILFIAAGFAANGQSYEGLIQLSGGDTKTYHSAGFEQQARQMADRCDRVLTFYNKLIDFKPVVTLLVLSKKDWNTYTGFPIYGMPHYNHENRCLIVASEDNDFWKSFTPSLENLSEASVREFSATYFDSNGNPALRSFFDLLAIHELGHAFHIQGGLNMQRLWMGELFANIFLHTYIAENEPLLLPVLTVLPKTTLSAIEVSKLTYTTLNELETNYETITQQFPQNYVWYQFRFHLAAEKIYDEGNTSAFKNLWDVLRREKNILNDADLAALLTNSAHPAIGKVMLNWNDNSQ